MKDVFVEAVRSVGADPSWFKFSPRTWLLMSTGMRNEDVCPLLEVAASIMTLWPDCFSMMVIGLQVESLSHIPFDMRNSRTYVFDNVAGPKP